MCDESSMLTRLQSMTAEDRKAFSSNLACKYGHVFTEGDTRILGHSHEFDSLAYEFLQDTAPLTVDDAKDLLLFCLFNEVGEDSGHRLADHVLLRLINGQLGVCHDSHEICMMFVNINKWYA